MSLIGHHCWTLDDALKLSLDAQKQNLYKLPGMINLWQIDPKFKSARLS